MKDVEAYETWIRQKENNPKHRRKVNKEFDKQAYINKQNYRIFLTNDEWKQTRQRILKRDNYCCKNCGKRHNLDAHHLLYIGNKPWNTPDRFLVTLCRDCHEKVHSGKLKIDKDRIVFGDNLMKRCFIIKLLWNNDLCLNIDLLRQKFSETFENENIYIYVKVLKEQGLIEIKDGNIVATNKEINRVRMTTNWDYNIEECVDL